jgi:hypothetical protein
MTPTVAHCVCFLPPEGAAAPAARRSRFRGGMAPTVAHCVCFLPPPRGQLRLRPLLAKARLTC